MSGVGIETSLLPAVVQLQCLSIAGYGTFFVRYFMILKTERILAAAMTSG
jgi:hypothetical protein